MVWGYFMMDAIFNVCLMKHITFIKQHTPKQREKTAFPWGKPSINPLGPAQRCVWAKQTHRP